MRDNKEIFAEDDLIIYYNFKNLIQFIYRCSSRPLLMINHLKFQLPKLNLFFPFIFDVLSIGEKGFLQLKSLKQIFFNV
jgi:hypothetical protein